MFENVINISMVNYFNAPENIRFTKFVTMFIFLSYIITTTDILSCRKLNNYYSSLDF